MLRLTCYVILICTAGLLLTCQYGYRSENEKHLSDKTEEITEPGGPASADSLSLILAERVMEAMGGWNNWQKTAFVQWDFFGARTLQWDRQNHRVRIDFTKAPLSIHLQLDSKQGEVYRSGKKVQDEDSLRQLLQLGYKVWINDSYWVAMPFKLKDAGVHLAYTGLAATVDSEVTHVIELTFDSVGVTPHNKYHVYVDTSDFLVRQWDYFKHASDTNPRMVTPWKGYKRYGELLFSTDRGEGHQLTNIRVADTIPVHLFETR